MSYEHFIIKLQHLGYLPLETRISSQHVEVDIALDSHSDDTVYTLCVPFPYDSTLNESWLALFRLFSETFL